MGVNFADSVNTKERTVTKVAEGVYVIRHKDSPDGNVNGNTTVIIGDKEVFVVDSCFQLSAAAEDIAQIRQWTDKPVRYLVITHFHNDHNMGNGLYKAAFPAITIIAHTDTKRDMYRTPTTRDRFVQYIAVREQRLKTGKGADGKPLTETQIADTAKSLAGKKLVFEELKNFVYEPPSLTFDSELNIDIGNREVQVKHLGRGATSGDAIVYLSKEKILIAGDLVTHPVLFTYDGYPSEWIHTLERLAQLDAVTIVPGHGEVLHDKEFIYLSRDLLKSAVEQVMARISRLTSTAEHPSLEEVQKGVDLTPFRQKFAGEDQDSLEAFDAAAAALVKVVYKEAMHNN
ncbi:MAG TPA: MBL fold metallo-hydrolase [Pyrinomonadaceae bacterium]|nr:MBL fold metallo-hydrolase [Pyrinomonadaceae bacterium]